MRSLKAFAIAGLTAAAVAATAAPAHATTVRPLDASGHFVSDGVRIWSGPGGTGTVNGLGAARPSQTFDIRNGERLKQESR